MKVKLGMKLNISLGWKKKNTQQITNLQKLINTANITSAVYNNILIRQIHDVQLECFFPTFP